MLRLTRLFLKARDGAVAPTYALALTGIVAMVGVGYDYGQIASLDTELQNAADQAALAAVTQLNGLAGSRANASTAAKTLVINRTVMAGDSATNPAITVDTLTYYKTLGDAEADTSPVTTDADARYVKVTLSTRTAKYALTPIVGLITSPSIGASATAGLEATLCKVPPVMICNPAADPTTFGVSNYVGKGLLLSLTPEAASGNTGFVAGQMGFLDPGVTRVTKKNLKVKQDFAKLLGYDAQISRCVSVTQPYTQDGNTQGLSTAFNTRFDIQDNGAGSFKCSSTNPCSPSDNARKDLVQKLTGNGATAPTSLSANDCTLNTTGGSNGWTLSDAPYRPTSGTFYKDTKPKTPYPDVMGYPRDNIHAYPGATTRSLIGTGVWDIDAYWHTNYKKDYAGDVGSAKDRNNPTRYEVYKWERSTGKIAALGRVFNGTGSTKFADYQAPICKTPGIAPSATAPDRRVLSAAVVDCSALPKTAGKAAVNPIEWIDVFLVEPSADRTNAAGIYTRKGEIYVEVIGPSLQGAAGTASQFTRRDKPYLIK